MALDFASLCDDVLAEWSQLADLLVDVAEEAWEVPTPSPDWTVRDQISHLAYFDHVALVAATDTEGFLELRSDVGDVQAFVDDMLAEGHGRSGAEMLSWWENERAALVETLRPRDPGDRVQWFGPSMSVASCLTARLMETWAHGQDVVDALGLDRPPTERLRNIAHIGVATYGHSFVNRRLDAPGEPVRVELVSPAGEAWTWGDEGSTDLVSGSALDFCLVVTMRRNVADTDLVVAGDAATAWMDIAQAFAGPVGQGRPRRS